MPPRASRRRAPEARGRGGLAALAILVALCAPGSASAGKGADEIHWTFTGPTSVTFDWRGGPATIRYGPTPAYGLTATASAPSPMPFSSAGPFWEAKLTGLAENAVYHYSIGRGSDHTFRTPPRRGGSDFTFYAEGDIGNGSDWKRMAVVQSMIAAGKPDFVLCVGDLTYATPVGQPAVDRHFDDVMVWSLDAAYMPAWGNHEWEEPKQDDMRNYKGRFDLPNPQASPRDADAPWCGGGEDWYWFDYGNVRFIAYPEPWSGAWSDWGRSVRPIMDQAQADSAIAFIVTFGHQPAYSSGYHEGEPKLREIMDSLGDRCSKYVLNLNGHSHDYERSHPQHGVVHVTAGVGGADLEQPSNRDCPWSGGCPPPAWSAFRAMHHAAIRVRVTASGMELTVFCGPPSSGEDEENDVRCGQGSVMDHAAIVARVAQPRPGASSPESDAEPK
ncbi:MAG TPA: metallophosphoesterase family protein [Candidatus Eisenbacteria bacterium]|jgi:hypothetical protein